MGDTTAVAGDEWRGRTGSSWAAEWVRTDRSFTELTGRLVAAVEAALGEQSIAAPGAQRHVLDIGCGAGETALRLATARSDIHVTGLDLSAELIAVARERAAGSCTTNVEFVEGDASHWHAPQRFDAALSRHGVMFFDDPVAAFAHLRTLIHPGAPLVFTCFAEREANVWANDLAALVGAPLPTHPHAPGPFAFSDPDRVAAILTAAGWRTATPERIDFAYVAGGSDDPVEDAAAFFLRIGPAARFVASLDAAARAALRPRLTNWLERFATGREVRLPAAAWLWRVTA